MYSCYYIERNDQKRWRSLNIYESLPHVKVRKNSIGGNICLSLKEILSWINGRFHEYQHVFGNRLCDWHRLLAKLD